MKKTLVGLVLPVLATVAIIGSGFAAWSFGDGTPGNNTGTGGLQVEQIKLTSQSVEITKAPQITLTLDQPTADNPNALGARFVYVGGDSEVVISKKSSLVETGKPLKVGLKLQLSPNAYTYIKSTHDKNNGQNAPLESGWRTYTWSGITVTTSADTMTATFNLKNIGANIDIGTFNYQDATKPTDTTSLGAMKTALDGKTTEVRILYTITV